MYLIFFNLVTFSPNHGARPFFCEESAAQRSDSPNFCGLIVYGLEKREFKEKVSGLCAPPQIALLAIFLVYFGSQTGQRVIKARIFSRFAEFVGYTVCALYSFFLQNMIVVVRK